ncbi:hypothetical protein E2C01_084768 [Portunus trituberculatus]|uniref:Uncharacterized protein n=1 Tax=Portunus trituberculatus TaxID=210409 RepID=A0A5B7JA59_PORTR|nr:hypothetical protein [Portunus trituberculatus]
MKSEWSQAIEPPSPGPLKAQVLDSYSKQGDRAGSRHSHCGESLNGRENEALIGGRGGSDKEEEEQEVLVVVVAVVMAVVVPGQTYLLVVTLRSNGAGKT